MSIDKSNNLFIVESPAKAKTIKKILGKNFTVLASVGHIRDLKSKGRGKKTFGIDVENNYQPLYEIIPGKESTIKELTEAVKKATNVYLAPDPDREGEAIAWHLKEVLQIPEERAFRVTYQAITKKAILEALENPGKINMNLVSAQQGRRVLDRLVGFSLSPFLWKKVAKNLSAGRVQSVAVKIIVDREREIQAFIPEEFWKIKADLAGTVNPGSFEAQLIKWNGNKFELGSPDAGNEKSAGSIAEILKKAEYKVLSVESKEAKGRPGAPFITSTLQQAASTQLHFSTTKTMTVAQKLYEGIELADGNPVGLITYMRTDSTRIAPEAIAEVREYIEKTWSGQYLPEEPNVYTTNKNAQDAHEAIRPSSLEFTPDNVKPFLSRDQFRLYELIWQRFVASQMKPAVYSITTVLIGADKGIFEAKGRVTLFDGYTVLVPEQKDENRYQDLPALAAAEKCQLNDLAAEQHFTKPPARYSEAGLVKALEKEGIGRPSTYAPIIKTIQERGYVRLVNRYFHASELGMAVNDILEANFHKIMELKFTADMENDLDSVEQGLTDWVKLVDDFYKPFAEQVKVAIDTAEALKNKLYTGPEKCPVCQSDLVIRYSTNGAFLGCIKYPECKGLLPLPEPADAEGEEGEDKIVLNCPDCGKPMVLKTSRFGKKFLACTGYPACQKTMSVDKEGKAVEPPSITRNCDKCGSPMSVKSGRKGFFLACDRYPECKFTMPIDKEGNVVNVPVVESEPCDKCGGEMVVRMSRRGPFLACSNFPKCRNAKPLDKTDKSTGE
jgi:DNA topoisomerase-1